MMMMMMMIKELTRTFNWTKNNTNNNNKDFYVHNNDDDESSLKESRVLQLKNLIIFLDHSIFSRHLDQNYHHRDHSASHLFSLFLIII